MNMNSFEPTPKRQKMHLDVGTAEALSMDEVAIIFSFLPHQDIMRARVCTSWREAAKKAIVHSRFVVDSSRSYNGMRALSTALPNLQYLSLHNFELGFNYWDLRELRRLDLWRAPLNRRYPDPVHINFPILLNLSIIGCHSEWDLEMLSAVPLLEKLHCVGNTRLTGDLISLRSLKDTLTSVTIGNCIDVEGSLMALADFPRLRKLELFMTSVEGDIRDIREHDFPVIKSLSLPSTVQGGYRYRFQHISDVPSFMQALHLLLQRTPTLFREHHINDNCDCTYDDNCDCTYDDNCKGLNWSLSLTSPDWYDWRDLDEPSPPFDLHLIHKGSRLGWIWCGDAPETFHERYTKYSCEINWLDPESMQNENSERFDSTYFLHLEEIGFDFYEGYRKPPNELEYHRLCSNLS